MTTEIDAAGLDAAADALERMYRGRDSQDEPFSQMASAAITAYLATTRTSEAEPVAWLHLPTGNVFGNDADYRKRLDAWKRQFGEHVIHDFEPLGRITLPTPASDDQVEAVRYRHKKRGTEYVLVGYGKMQAENWYDDKAVDGSGIVDMREVAIYRSVDDGSLWVRPREEFEDGRFEPLAAMGSTKP